MQCSQCKEARKEKWRKRKEEKKTSSPRGENQTHNPHLARQVARQGSSPIATFTLHKDPWLQLFYEYHEGTENYLK